MIPNGSGNASTAEIIFFFLLILSFIFLYKGLGCMVSCNKLSVKITSVFRDNSDIGEKHCESETGF